MNYRSPCSSISCSSSPSETILNIGCIIGKCNDQLPKDSSLNSPSPLTPSNVNSSGELMNEISTLEVKILQLERHLLSLYRTAFQHNLPALLGNHGFKEKTITHKQNVKSIPVSESIQNGEGCLKMALSDISHDYQMFPSCAVPSLSNPTQSEFNLSSTKERRNAVSNRISLADYLSTSLVDDIHNYPDKLSREILKCISSIYCKFANPVTSRRGLSVSSISSLSSSSTFSSACSSSPRVDDEPTCHVNIDNLNSDTIEVLKIGLDDVTFQYASRMLQHFRSLVESLEKVDPMKMKREEKLAFWINIHNSLVMHAYLAYGTYGSVRSPSVLKAAYNVGGLCVKAYEIQSSILGIHSHYSTPWLKSLLSPRRRFMTGTVSEHHPYAIEYVEPLVHFALASGTSSDPVVRVYTTNNVFPGLKVARDEFIRANIYVEKSSKRILMPRIMYYYSKDMSLNMSEVLEIACRCLPELQQNDVRTCIKRRGHDHKHVCWAPQSSSFRYLIHKDVVSGV